MKSPSIPLALGLTLCMLGGPSAPARAETKAGAREVFGLYKSDDRGASWTKVGRDLPSGARINALGQAGNVVLAGTDRGIFVSRDAGKGWKPATQGAGPETRVLSLATLGGRVFAGTQKHGVLASDDEGVSWKPASEGLADPYVRSLLVAGSRVYAGTDRQGVFISEDRGATWTNARGGLPDSSQVFDLIESDGSVYAALYANGLYRWEPAERRWTRIGEVVPLEVASSGGSLVVGHNPGGVFVSDDRGKTWRDGNTGLPDNAPVWALAADDSVILVGTTGRIGLAPEEIGLFGSKDRGKSWIRCDAGLPPRSAAVSFVITSRFVLAGVSTGTTPGP